LLLDAAEELLDQAPGDTAKHALSNRADGAAHLDVTLVRNLGRSVGAFRQAEHARALDEPGSARSLDVHLVALGRVAVGQRHFPRVGPADRTNAHGHRHGVLVFADLLELFDAGQATADGIGIA